MIARDVHISPQTEGKGRTFRSAVLGLCTADTLWDGGSGGGDNLRPVLAVFAGSDQELRPFMANARSGRRVSFAKDGYRRKEDRLELLKSARYELAWQRSPEGSTCTAFLPDLFRVDTGMVDPDGVSFVAMPRQAWLDAQVLPDPTPAAEHVDGLLRGMNPRDREESFPTLDELRASAPMAHLFAVYLDRRTRCPIVADPRFHMQLMYACLADGLACYPRSVGYGSYIDTSKLGYRSALVATEGLEQLGFARAVAMRASHESVEKLLAEQTTIFFDSLRA